MPDNPSFVQQLIEAGAALGETAGILDIPYLRQAHQRRQRIFEAVGSAAIDGRDTTPERLYAWLLDIPIEGQLNAGAEGYAAEIFRALVDPYGPSSLAQEAQGLLHHAQAQAGRDPLAAAAVLFRGRDGIHAASRLAYARFLRHALGPAEPAVSPFLRRLESAAVSSRHLDVYVAAGLHKAARQALSNARTLRAAMATVYGVLGTARAHSSIRRIAELLFAGHPLTVAVATRRLKISRVSAQNHLAALEKAGLAAVATRWNTGKVYIARDGLMTFAAPQPVQPAPRITARLAVASPALLTVEERARLDAAADAVAGDMAELDRLLARLTKA